MVKWLKYEWSLMRKDEKWAMVSLGLWVLSLVFAFASWFAHFLIVVAFSLVAAAIGCLIKAITIVAGGS